MRFKNNSCFLLLLMVSSLIISGCKTTKNTFLNRNYHTTTTRYNWYFNARENFKSGVNNLENQLSDDFNQRLEIYPLGTEKEAQSIFPQMDKSLKKCAKAINKHSMLIKGREYNRWIDDCYLLIGKAYFYKQEYIKAVEAFRLVSRQFVGNTSAHESQLWLINSYIALGDLSSADLVIENVLIDETFPEGLSQQLSLTLANYHLSSGDNDLATEELLAAISLTKKKRDKARYMYILAQLYSEQQNYVEATNYFTKVIRTSPNYEMVFNARINRARSFDTSSGNSDLIVEELLKMLKDDKNIEYRDVIYFGLAELNNRKGEINQAVDYYTKSVATSVKNDAQKSLSSVILADQYYQQQNYRLAQAYYDTTVAFMNPNHHRYPNALTKQKTLTDLVLNLNIIQEQDSLQRIALMPEKERFAFIDKLIEEFKQQEREQREQELQRRSENNFFNDPLKQNNPFNRNQNTSGVWYFENPNTLSFGFSEFNRKWGKRKLEDNWRRTNKKTLTVEEALADTISEEEFDPKSRDSYINNLPLTIDDIKASNIMIIEAHFDAGVIYKEQLSDVTQAIKMFEQLNERFPFSENRAMVLYFLNRLHDERGNLDFANDYKEKLIVEFPNSDYAKLIQDPNYANDLSKAGQKLEDTYKVAFSLYSNSKFSECIALCKNTNKTNPNNPLFPNFEFLQTMAGAYNKDKNAYTQSLEKIIEKHPKHAVAESAKLIITQLSASEQTTTQASTAGDSQYILKDNVAHYFILLFQDFDLEVSLAKSTLSDYHSEYYRLANLNISSLLFSDHTHLITVREFNNKVKAMEYYNAFQDGDVRGVFGNNYQAFVIAGPNFSPFYKNKDINGYTKMFQKNYLQ